MLEKLEHAFAESNSKISGIEQLINNSIKRVRIIASGAVTKPLVLKGLGVTAGARIAVEKVGGKIEEKE